MIRDQHAKLVTCVEDINNELGDAGDALGAASSEPPDEQRAPASAVSGLTDAEQAVLAAIDHEEKSIETIAETTGQPAAKVAATLITLQLRGLARQLPGNLFIRVKRR